MTGVKKEEQSPRIGTFEFALAEAKKRAWAANPIKKLPPEENNQASTPVIAEQVKAMSGKDPGDKPPHANKYGGLTAAKKRKCEETATTNAVSPATRSEDSSSISSPLLTPTEEVKAMSGKEPDDKPTHANKYGLLLAATKRKREKTATADAASLAPRSEDSSSVSSPLPTPTEESSNRPFAPPKKAKRVPTKYDDM